MTDANDTDAPAAGGNSRAQIVAYAERMQRLLDDKAAIDEDIKALKGEMKVAAFGKDEMKAFAQCVKELRRGADYQADQQQLELVLDTYRGALGLPRNLEVAQQRARAAAESLPDDGESAFGEGDTVSIDGGPEMPAREFARAVRKATPRGKRGRLN